MSEDEKQIRQPVARAGLGGKPTSAAVTIRLASMEDAAGITQLSEALGYPVDADTIGERLRRLHASRDDRVVVAEAGSGQIVGWLHAAKRLMLESEQRCEILGLIVDREFRGKGIASQLVAAVESWARSNEIPEMAVASNIVREESHPFYERLGYTRVKTQHIYRKPL